MGRSGGQVLGAAGALCGCGVPVVLLAEGRAAQPEAVYKLDPAARGGCRL
eukprot:gene29457-3984_t